MINNTDSSPTYIAGKISLLRTTDAMRSLKLMIYDKAGTVKALSYFINPPSITEGEAYL